MLKPVGRPGGYVLLSQGQPCGHAIGLVVGFDHLKDFFAGIVLFQQLTERQDHRLILNPLAHMSISENVA